jgi:xanthine/uracil/vitamin C permease (AzgA family)
MQEGTARFERLLVAIRVAPTTLRLLIAGIGTVVALCMLKSIKVVIEKQGNQISFVKLALHVVVKAEELSDRDLSCCEV